MTSPIEQAYPHITLWVKTHGWIEIGGHDYSHSFVRALDEGGMVWEGSDSYETLDMALGALEGGLVKWMNEVG